MHHQIKHIPLQPPRQCTPMEGIYLGLWKDFAIQQPEEWAAIFHDCSFTPRQRAASVAASFMVFMGCNGGRGFTFLADELARSKEFTFAEPAYIAAWALENRRFRGTNCGLRCIEYMLASEYPIQKHGIFKGRVNWQKVPTVTMKDQDVIECMVRWWAGATARLIRKKAAAMLAEHQASVRLAHHLEHNAA